MKKLLASLLLFMSIVPLTSCGDSLESPGIYVNDVIELVAKEGKEITASVESLYNSYVYGHNENIIVLRRNGKGEAFSSYSSGSSYSGNYAFNWKVDYYDGTDSNAIWYSREEYNTAGSLQQSNYYVLLKQGDGYMYKQFSYISLDTRDYVDYAIVKYKKVSKYRNLSV